MLKNFECDTITQDDVHNELLLQLNEIKKLSIRINKLFENNHQIGLKFFSNPTVFNWEFKKEYYNGFIEYKRTLSTYTDDGKIDKLIRQIYWRIYEGITMNNINYCYYIIGLEDSGSPSYVSIDELEKSILIIDKAITSTSTDMCTNTDTDTRTDTELKFSYLCMCNTNLNYNFVVVKIMLDKNNQCIDYFL